MWPVPSQAQDPATPRLPAAPRGEGRAKAIINAVEFWGRTSSPPRLSCQGHLGVGRGVPGGLNSSPCKVPETKATLET